VGREKTLQANKQKTLQVTTGDLQALHRHFSLKINMKAALNASQKRYKPSPTFYLNPYAPVNAN